MPTVPLSTIAHGRSGDKGNHANVAVIAYTDAGFAWLRENLTADVVAAYFASLGASKVEFEAANARLELYAVDASRGRASDRYESTHKGRRALALLRMKVEIRRIGERRGVSAETFDTRRFTPPFAGR